MARTVGDIKWLCTAALLMACGSGTGTGPEAGPDQALRRAALENIGRNVILTQYEDFASRAAALDEATARWQTEGTDEARQAAQAAWSEAMGSWQHAEVFQIGPAGIMGVVQGGEDVRDLIYSWPLSSACRVDQEIVSQDYADAATFFADEGINVRGLDALEYLLFKGGDQNACSAASGINSSGDWAALGAAEIDTRRAAYAAALARDVRTRADGLVTRWSPEGGDFLAEVARAGDGSQTYPSTQEALNALTDAMFYVEKETKDMKLAIPLGISDCDTDLCLDARESTWADFSKEKMIANLEAFRAVYTGGEGEGFDDILVALGAQELADQMLTATDEAIAALEAWPGTFKEQLENDPESVQLAYVFSFISHIYLCIYNM